MCPNIREPHSSDQYPSTPFSYCARRRSYARVCPGRTVGDAVDALLTNVKCVLL